MEKEKTACFTGHRTVDLPFKEDENDKVFVEYKKMLEYAIIYLHQKHGICDFISGMALGIDTIAAETVIALRDAGLKIRLLCAIPCRTQSSRWTSVQRARYGTIIDAADEVVVLSEEYTNTCMAERNQYMVDNSAYCIATWKGSIGGTSSTVRIARKKGIKLIIIDPTVPRLVPESETHSYPEQPKVDLLSENEGLETVITDVSLGGLKGKMF